MKFATIPAFLLPALAASRVLRSEPQLAEALPTSIIPLAIPASIPNSDAPAQEQGADANLAENLDLRQAPAVVPAVTSSSSPVAAVVPVPAVTTSSSPVAAVPVPAVTTSSTPVAAVPKPAVTSSTTTSPVAAVPAPVVPVVTSSPVAAVPGAPASIEGIAGVSITVQWQETMIGGTSKTWVPVTITVAFAAVPSQAPPPGKGVIGMGTLTGEVGVTKTVVHGAAATQAPAVMGGLVAAMGVGLMGMVV